MPGRPSPIVAVHAVVAGTTTMVGSNVATETALELDVGLLVGLAESYPVFIVFILTEKSTSRTDEFMYSTIYKARIFLLPLELLNISIIATLSQSAKVCILTSKALIVIEMINCKFFKVVEVLTFRILYSFIKVQTFVFSSKYSFFLDLCLKIFSLVKDLLNPLENITLWYLHKLIA